MKYTVVWVPKADSKLTELWIDGPDRADIAAAADRIDQLLSHDASTKGEGREGNRRILICEPLAVYFTVSEDDRLVTVTAVWRWTA